MATPLLNTPAKASEAAVAQLSLLGWAIINVAKYRKQGKLALAATWQRRMENRLKVYKLLLQHLHWFSSHRFTIVFSDEGYKLRVDRNGCPLNQLTI